MWLVICTDLLLNFFGVNSTSPWSGVERKQGMLTPAHICFSLLFTTDGRWPIVWSSCCCGFQRWSRVCNCKITWTPTPPCSGHYSNRNKMRIRFLSDYEIVLFCFAKVYILIKGKHMRIYFNNNSYFLCKCWSTCLSIIMACFEGPSKF